MEGKGEELLKSPTHPTEKMSFQNSHVNFHVANCGHIAVQNGFATVCPYPFVPAANGQCKDSFGNMSSPIIQQQVQKPAVGSSNIGHCLLNQTASGATGATWACANNAPVCAANTTFVDNYEGTTFSCHPRFTQKLPSGCSP